MSEHTFKPGDFVKHKLTGEKMLVLPADSIETYNRRETYKVRTMSFDIKWLFPQEIDAVLDDDLRGEIGVKRCKACKAILPPMYEHSGPVGAQVCAKCGTPQ